jgi:hypothetical protein
VPRSSCGVAPTCSEKEPEVGWRYDQDYAGIERLTVRQINRSTWHLVAVVRH